MLLSIYVLTRCFQSGDPLPLYRLLRSILVVNQPQQKFNPISNRCQSGRVLLTFTFHQELNNSFSSLQENESLSAVANSIKRATPFIAVIGNSCTVMVEKDVYITISTCSEALLRLCRLLRVPYLYTYIYIYIQWAKHVEGALQFLAIEFLDCDGKSIKSPKAVNYLSFKRLIDEKRGSTPVED